MNQEIISDLKIRVFNLQRAITVGALKQDSLLIKDSITSLHRLIGPENAEAAIQAVLEKIASSEDR